MKFLSGLALAVLFSTNLSAQSDTTTRVGWFVGGTGGAFFANDSTSTYYNGRNEFGIDWIIGIQQYYDQIFQSVGQRDFTVEEYPDLVQNYRTAFTLGGNGGYYTSEQAAIFFDVQITTLKTADVWLLAVDDQVNFEPILTQASIIGEEKRLHINLGYRRLLGTSETGNLFMELGGSFQNTSVEKNQIMINSLNYNLLRPVIPNNPNNPQINVGGSGFGAFIGTGLNYQLNPNFAFDLGLHLRWDKVILNPALENRYSMQGLLFLRLIYQ